MIKLNDNGHTTTTHEEAVASPRTAASNTPTGLLDSDSGDHVSSSLSNHSAGYEVAPGDAPTLTMTAKAPLSVLAETAADAATLVGENGVSVAPAIFGQITMETRSTRKFLIKHHPYLQLSNSAHHPNGLSRSMVGKQQQTAPPQERPSIDLIKMKRMIYGCSNSSPKNSHLTETALSRSGRCIRLNQVGSFFFIFLIFWSENVLRI